MTGHCGKRLIITFHDLFSAAAEHRQLIELTDNQRQSVAFDPIRDICKKHGLVLIEDGAHVIGTKYKGQPNGSSAIFGPHVR